MAHASKETDAQNPLAHNSDETRQDNDHRRNENVSVTDMRKLVSNHAFQFGFMEFLQRALGYCNGGVFSVPAGGKGIDLLRGDNIDAGDWQTGGNREIFDNAEQLQMLKLFGQNCMRHG